MRTLGVEEEFLVIDPHTGCQLPFGDKIAELAKSTDPKMAVGLVTELQREQVESVTEVCQTLSQLHAAICQGRLRADSLAGHIGARIAALAVSPIPVEPHITQVARYEAIADRFGLLSRDQLTGGFHVHVSINSAYEGVGILDRIRAWLPALLALSANSPLWNGLVTGYSSFRRNLLTRLPLSGPGPGFGSVDGYHDEINKLLDTEVPLDEGMIYFDARLCRHHPTIEIRVADVCLDVGDAVLIAALTRALVETAARELAAGQTAPDISQGLMQLAMWQASKSGLRDVLLDPTDFRPRKAAEVIAMLVDYVRPVLMESGDEPHVIDLVAAVLGRGTGADLQLSVYDRSGSLPDVVSEAIKHTHSEI